jgi:hypothetical protein
MCNDDIMADLCDEQVGGYRHWPGWVLSNPFRFRGLTSPTLRAAEVRPLLLHRTAPTQESTKGIRIFKIKNLGCRVWRVRRNARLVARQSYLGAT